jgi:hypothetical protein
VETGEVNKRLKIASEQARAQAVQRRQKDADAQKEFDTFLDVVATPLMKQLASALKAQGHGFTLFTPAGGLRLASDRQRDDFIELALERDDAGLQVVGHISHVRGSRTLTQTRPVTSGASPGSLTDEQLLSFLLEALRPWLER